MIDYLKIIQEKYQLEELDIKEYSKVKVGPMTFKIHCYDIKDIGRVSLMEGSAMLGLMKMTTLMFTSFYKDLPLISLDRIQVLKNDTLICEAYDTLKNKREFKNLSKIKDKSLKYPEYIKKEAWYDKIRLPISISIKEKNKRDQIDELEKEYLQTFLDSIKDSDDISLEEKLPLQKIYVEGLLSNGGSSTDQFIKAIGLEKTQDLFRNYLFGTK